MGLQVTSCETKYFFKIKPGQFYFKQPVDSDKYYYEQYRICDQVGISGTHDFKLTDQEIIQWDADHTAYNRKDDHYIVLSVIIKVSQE